MVAGHRAGRGVGAAPARPAAEGPLLVCAQPRAERHRRRPRRAARLPRFGLRVRPGGPRVRGVRGGHDPPGRDAPGARPLLRCGSQERRRSGGERQPVHVWGLVGGVRAVPDRESPFHTLPRRPTGDGEDEAEAVGAGGGAVPTQPFLNKLG